MLAIKLNNEFFDLDPKASAQLIWNNPIFQLDVLYSDYSLSLTLPPSDKNKRMLGYSQLINIDAVQRNYSNAGLYYKNIRFVNGELIILNISERGFEVHIAFGISQSDIGNKRLPDINLGGTRTIGTNTDEVIDHFLDTFGLNYPDTDYVFPMMYHPEFYGDRNTEYLGYVNYLLGFSIGVPEANIIASNVAQNKYNIVPFPFLMYVLRQAFKEIGWRVEGTFCDDEDFKQLIIYNNFALDKKPEADDCRLQVSTLTDIDYAVGANPFIQFTDKLPFDDESTGDNIDSAAAYDNATFIYTINKEGAHRIEVCLLIDSDIDPATLYSVDFYVWVNGVNTIISTSGYTGAPAEHKITHDFIADNAMLGSTVYVEALIATGIYATGTTMSIKATGSYLKTTPVTYLDLNIFDTELNLQNHVPDITFGDFLDAIRKGLNIAITFDMLRQIVTMDLVTDVINGLAPDITSKGIGPIDKKVLTEKIRSVNWSFDTDDGYVQDNFATFNESLFIGSYQDNAAFPTPTKIDQYLYCICENKMYRSALPDPESADIEWVIHADAYYELVFNSSGKTDIRPAVSPLFMEIHTTSEGEIVMPAIKQQGSSNSFGLGANDFAFRISIWRCYGLSTTGAAYPWASAINSNMSAGGLFGSLAVNRSLVYDNWDAPGEISGLWTAFVAMYNNGINYIHKIKYNVYDILTLAITEPKFRNFQKYMFRKLQVRIGKKIEVAEAESNKY